MNVPEGYQAVMPYLIIHNATDFIAFTRQVFGAELKEKHMRDENLVMHAEIVIGGSVIMLADTTPQHATQNAGLFVYVQDADAAYRKALEAGATSLMAPADQSYGRSGGVKDAYGNTWWITSIK